jgi:hypothetical protein
MIQRVELWAAVYPDAKRELGERLPELMKKASHRWGGLRWPADAVPPGGVRPENVVYTSEDSGEIRHMFVVLTGRTIGPSRIGAAYPFVPHGTPVEVEIKELHPHETGIEGEVTARVAGHDIRYFEPLWGVRRAKYKPGAAQRVRFAGFAHALQAMSGADALEGAPVPGTGAGEPSAAPLSAAPGAAEEAAPTAPATAGSAAALPPIVVPSDMVMIGPGGSSRYGFHAPIVEWRGFWVGERLYYALKLRLAEGEGRDFAVEVYAGRHCFKGSFSPARGIALAGVVWLHGTLVE